MKTDTKEIVFTTEQRTYFEIPKDIDLKSVCHWYGNKQTLFIKVNKEDKEYLEFEGLLGDLDLPDISYASKAEDINGDVLWRL